MGEVKEAIDILKGPDGPGVREDEEFIAMPDPKVAGCVLVGMKKAKFAALVYTEDHFDALMRGEWEKVDWDRAAIYFERYAAGLDGEALLAKF